MYFYKENNYSGEFSIKNKTICCNQILSYYQGLYKFDNNFFWETIEQSFDEELNFEMYCQKINIDLNDSDKQYLRSLFDNYAVLKKFQNL